MVDKKLYRNDHRPIGRSIGPLDSTDTLLIHSTYMPTTKARINISVSEDVRSALIRFARRDHVPQATKAARLLETALELEEDHVWDTIATRRNTSKARYVSHANAWK